MTLTIETECVLANALAGEHSTVTIRELNDIRNRLRKQLHDVYVDLSRDALIGAANRRPDLFWWDDNTVGRTSKPKKTLDPAYAEEYVNWRIPATIRSRFVALCQL
jgi:hypothetical protein